MKMFVALGVGALLVACASTPTVDSIVTEGGKIIEGGFGSLVSEEGTTITGVDDSWTAYFSPDGRKELLIKPKNKRETLSWRKKEDGTFCEILSRTKKEQCYDNNVILVQDVDGVYSRFTDGEKGKYPFFVRNGNTNGF